MKILGLKSVLIGAILGAVWASLGGVGVANGQTAGQAGQAATTAKRPMTFADLMAIKRVSDPQISPSGKWVMFSVTDVSLEKNSKTPHLWVVPLDGSAPERQLTSASGETFGRFSPDGYSISLTLNGQIYVAPWDEATGKLGAWGEMTNVAGGADGAIWSPDSKRLMFTADVYPECSDKPSWAEENACDKAKDDAAAASPVKGQVWDALLYRHWDQYTGEKRSHVLLLNLEDVTHVRDLTPRSAVGDAETPTWFLDAPLQYAWAPDSKEIAYVTNLDKVPAASTNNDVFTLRLDEPGAKAVKVSTSLGSDDAPAYSPDGKWLAFRSQARAGFESDKFDLVVMDRANGFKGNQTAGTLGGWVDEFSWSLDSSFIAFASGSKGEEAIYLAATSPEMAGLPCCIKVTSAGEFSDLRPDLTRQRLIATRMTMDSPSTIVTMPFSLKQDITQDLVAERDIKPLTHLNDPLISTLYLSPLETFWFAGADGTKVQGFILRPPGFDPAKKYPVKFVMHGGPQTALGDSWSYRWNWELLAADGYVVVGINRRGSTGYGQKFVDEVSGDWGGRAYEDLMKGLDYAEAHYPFIDKTRECALGASYGGFMADWVLTHTDRFQCVVTHDGMFDPVSAYGSTEELWFNEWEFRRPEDFPKGWDGMAGAGKGEGHAAEPWRYQNLPADQDPFRKWSPMRFIENAKTPTLIIHSQRDYRLDVSQGFELYAALQRRNVPSKFLYFPDEGHWVLKPQNSQLWYQTVDDWCDRWTKSGKYAEKQ